MKKAIAAAIVFAASLTAACSGPTRLADVAYDSRFGASTTLDLYLPDGGGPAPAVLFIHGGLFRSGDKSEYQAAASRLAASGYVAATMNHRLAPGAPFPAALRDASCALSFLRAGAGDYGIEPDRIAVAGYSSGAYLAAMLGVSAGEDDVAADCAAGRAGPPAAVAANAGLYDLTRVAGKADVQALLGATIEDEPQRYRDASPALRVRPGAPPFLLVRGDFDFSVPPEQTSAMRDALRAEGNDVRSLELLDPGHFLAAGADNGGLYGGGAKDRPESWIALIAFLEETIGSP
jgi:acetyl esterase/lipase